MLTAEANQRITQVGPGTPMGELMRRYWIPIRPLVQILDKNVNLQSTFDQAVTFQVEKMVLRKPCMNCM